MNVSGSTPQDEVANSEGFSDPSASAYSANCSVSSSASDASAPASKRHKTVRKYDSTYIKGCLRHICKNGQFHQSQTDASLPIPCSL